ncbi:MAG: EAL domain-containing protein [Sphaerochaetaceae bacterium]
MEREFLFQRVAVVAQRALRERLISALEGLDVEYYPHLNRALEKIHAKILNPLVIVIESENTSKRALKKLEVLDSNLIRVVLIASEPPGKASQHDFVVKPVDAALLREKVEFHLTALEKIDQLLKAKKLEEVFASAFESAPIGITISSYLNLGRNVRERYDYINPMYEKIVGRDRETILSLDWPQFTHPADLEGELAKFKQLQKGKIKSYALEKRYVRPDGSIVWVNLIASKFDLAPYKYVCIVQDITKSKNIELALKESERSKTTLFDHLPGIAYRCKNDPDWTMEFISDGCEKLTGYPASDLINNSRLSFNEVIAFEYRTKIWNVWQQVIQQEGIFEAEYEIINASGKRVWVLERGQAVYGTQKEVIAIEGVILDISKRKENEMNFLFHYHHDSLTGLHNRRYFEALLENSNPALERGVIAVNLSAIHELSVRHGFYYAQAVLKRIASEMEKLKADDIEVFSLYENWFAFYVQNYTTAQCLVDLGNRISHVLEEFLTIERVVWGIGIIEIPKGTPLDIEQLLTNLMLVGDRSLASNSGEFEIVRFDEQIVKDKNRQTKIGEELAALKFRTDSAEGFYLNYQPIINLKNGEIWGFEALARLNSREVGQVPPLEFIPIAEKTKLIIPIGDEIIRMACSFLSQVHNMGYPHLVITINICLVQLMAKGFVERLIKIIEECNIAPGSVMLEITETAMANDYYEINIQLRALRKRGFHIALDDFGTGYSSLARERELAIDCIKIDKVFIDGLQIIKKEEAISGDIISMAHKLGHCVIAEGVEHQRQRDLLLEFNCDLMQGYLISKPLEEEKALKLLSKGPF